MRENGLRLRLVVRRHALPEVRVVFNVSLDNDPTIANLLGQIDEIFPLESNDWGLEDYAVELRDADGHGFDCLHFQQVAVVLKNDEEIFIRPLVTEDRKKRLLSGRHQISTDGRHLIDGVPFGRPRLKAPRDRPPVDIPPLKRRRIAYEPEGWDAEVNEDDPPLLLMEHGEDNEDPTSVRVRATSDDLDDDTLESEEDAENEDDENEDDDFVNEGGDDGDDDMDEVDEEDGFDDSEIDEELRDLRMENAELGDLDDEEPEPSQLLQKDHDTQLTVGEMRVFGESLHAKGLSVADDSNPDDSDAESVEPFVKHYDEHGFPAGSILAGTASTHIAETLRKSGKLVKLPVHTKFGEAHGDKRGSGTAHNMSSALGTPENTASSGTQKLSQSSSDSSSDNGDSSSSSDGDNDKYSDSDSDGDSGPEVTSSKIAPRIPPGRMQPSSDSESESSSNDDSSSDSSSDSGSDSESFGENESDSDSDDNSDSDSDSDSAMDSSNENSSASNNHAQDSSSERGGDSTSEPSQTKFGLFISSVGQAAITSRATQAKLLDAVSSHRWPSASEETVPPVPPGQGMSRTQKRNARKRATMKAFRASQRTASGPVYSDLDYNELASQVQSTAAKEVARLKRLKALEPSPKHDMGVNDKEAHKHPSSTSTTIAGEPDSGTSVSPHVEALDTTSASSQRKARLDVGAGRRMVFSSLGLKNPKTKADEDKIRSDLMKDVRPLANPRLEQPSSVSVGQESHGELAPDNDESWREKISYCAVECIQEGVELSEPPFPFVQRWDPQQQGFWKDKTQRGGRSKRKQRDQASFYDDYSQPDAKRRRVAGYTSEDNQDGMEGESYISAGDGFASADVTLNYDDEPQDVAEQNNIEESQDLDEDLPPVPSDLSTLPAFQPSAAQPGMVLTWTQWVLSKATQWQPQVSTRTGVVVDIYDRGTCLRVRLAKRDRNLDQNEKVYDEDGNRVYDKFEAPEMDEEPEEGAELGYRTLEVADMVEPRILQRPSGVSNPASAQPHAGSSGNESAPEMESADGKPEPNLGGQSSTPAHDQLKSGQNRYDHVQVDSQRIDETEHPAERLENMGDHPAAQSSCFNDTSLTEDRRHEISLLIRDAGFRKEVDPSLANAETPDLSSPSRQLELMSQEAASAPRILLEPQLTTSSATTVARSHTTPLAPDEFQQQSKIPGYVDSQPVLLDQFNGFSDGPRSCRPAVA
ncbi:hypothetical protein B0T26DRAFT_296054 [Lasiosphaeria miniovina]|uniref:DUF7357 domain-containing protein n=1 Tax=Lasiosphaeria miniovina TaxID=1954250 RepID=A0AA40DUZ7_9PEZI|nr:uncharacterized protein B0T26DRAFT_296054 [Lasiosphaeria miniovina]KAK0717394.1 hypothetical protein B0T26DRAFT_296054 [Lasiosphaeria miniovina]